MPLDYEIIEPETDYELIEPEVPERAPSLFEGFGPLAGVPRSSEERAQQTFQRLGTFDPMGRTPPPTEGMLSVAGITPESVPSGKGPISIPLSSIARTGVGIADYLTSPQGIYELASSLTPAKLLVMAKWAADMASGAGHEAGTLSSLISKPNKTLEDWQKISDSTVNTAAMVLGAGKLGSNVGEKATGIRAPVGRALIEPLTIGRQATLAKDLAQKLEQAGPEAKIPTAVRVPERRLGIPIPEGQFAQPGIPALADAALAEAMRKIIIPGQEGAALQALRKGIEPPQILLTEPTRTAQRIPGGGQAPYGKVSYMRGAEAPTTERTQNAIQQEAKTILRNVQQPEVAQEGAQPLPVAQGRPEAVETREVKLSEGLENSSLDAIAKEVAAPAAAVSLADVQAKLRRGERLTVEEMSVLEKEQAAHPEKWEVWWVEDGKNQNRPFTSGSTAQEFAQELQSRKAGGSRIGGIQVKQAAEKAPPPEGDIISKLESLKLKEGDAGLLGSEELGAGLNLPNPEVLKAIGRSAWNTGIDLAIAAVKAGKSLAEAIETAMAHIRKNAAGKFDDNQVRANLDFVIRGETGSKVYPVEGEAVGMRKSAERATTSEMVPEPVQERIKTAPESFYTQQSMKRVEDAVGTMPESELAAVPRDSNLYTAAKLEQARRLFERGENDAGYNVFAELEKEGTRLGQLINQFKLLKGTRPEQIVNVVNKILRKEGKDPLTKQQETDILNTSKKSKDTDAALDKATDEWRKNPTPENAATAEKALDEANKTAVELQRKISRFTPRSTSAILKSVLQGNLLTPISEVANVFGNMSFLPFRAMDRTIASGLDIVDSFLRKRPREVVVQPIHATAEAVKGLGRGAKQIPDILLRGTGDVIKGESSAGLHPIRAWINQFSKNPEMPTTGGKITLKDRINLAIEGTIGVPAEAMLRGLGAGDIAFREAARSRIVANELKLANVPRAKWGFAQKFPELFLDAPALERIHTETMAAIFQRQSKTLNLMTGWLRGKGDLVDLGAATVAPYKTTPWNIVGEILSYNPLVAMAKTLTDAKNGNSRAAKLNAGKFVVGSLLTTTGWWLYKDGLLSPSLDQRDEAQKSRILAGQVLPPNHINLSGLKRKLAGGDPTFKPGDETVDVFRAGGLAGSAFYMTANIGRDLERQPETSGAETWGKIIRESTLEQARFGMNQSFLSGVEGLLSAIREGNVDTYLRQWGNTVASIPFPNSLTVLSRATREYKPDFRAEGFAKQAENIVRNRLGVAKMDDYLPLKRGLWGEPLPETPKDRNALVYHFFDVFKNKQVTSDPVPLELYRIWRKTDDTRVIPSLVEKSLTIANKTYPLTAEQQSRYAELVGQSRRKIVDALVVNPNFYKLSDEIKVKFLDQVYDAGLDQGKAMFWKEAGASLTPKPPRAGFAPARQPGPNSRGLSR